MENGNYGEVTQVIGSTLDARFPEGKLPEINNALKIEVERTVLGETRMETLWCEVAQLLGGGRVRAIALDSTDGVPRGARILDTGSHDELWTRCELYRRLHQIQLDDPGEGAGPPLAA